MVNFLPLQHYKFSIYKVSKTQKRIRKINLFLIVMTYIYKSGQRQNYLVVFCPTKTKLYPAKKISWNWNIILSWFVNRLMILFWLFWNIYRSSLQRLKILSMCLQKSFFVSFFNFLFIIVFILLNDYIQCFCKMTLNSIFHQMFSIRFMFCDQASQSL